MNEPHQGMVNVVVALVAEAKPLIAHFDLERIDRSGPFATFVGDHLQLVVSGLGRDAAAAATGYLFHFGNCLIDQGWLNVGVAGHGSEPLGRAFMAHKIVAPATDQRWYPPQVFAAPCPTAEVHTVSKLERDYPQPVLYEMEAAGFVAAATRFATSELVQVIKIVSDNRSKRVDSVKLADVARHVRGQLDVIDATVSALRAIATEQVHVHQLPAELPTLLGRHHFTTSQQYRLRQLLRRWAL